MGEEQWKKWMMERFNESGWERGGWDCVEGKDYEAKPKPSSFTVPKPGDR